MNIFAVNQMTCMKGNFNGRFCQIQCNHTKPTTQVVFSE